MQSKLLDKAGGQRIFAVIVATGDEVFSSLQEFVEHENIMPPRSPLSALWATLF